MAYLYESDRRQSTLDVLALLVLTQTKSLAFSRNAVYKKDSEVSCAAGLPIVRMLKTNKAIASDKIRAVDRSTARSFTCEPGYAVWLRRLNQGAAYTRKQQRIIQFLESDGAH